MYRVFAKKAGSTIKISTRRQWQRENDWRTETSNEKKHTKRQTSESQSEKYFYINEIILCIHSLRFGCDCASSQQKKITFFVHFHSFIFHSRILQSNLFVRFVCVNASGTSSPPRKLLLSQRIRSLSFLLFAKKLLYNGIYTKHTIFFLGVFVDFSHSSSLRFNDSNVELQWNIYKNPLDTHTYIRYREPEVNRKSERRKNDKIVGRNKITTTK